MEYVMQKRKEKGMSLQKKYEGEFDRLFSMNSQQKVNRVEVNEWKSYKVKPPASFMKKLDTSYQTRSKIPSKVESAEKKVKLE